jgi:hypothetical protein
MFERNTFSTLYDLPLSTAPVKGAKAAVAIFDRRKRPRKRFCRTAARRRRGYPRVAPRTPLTSVHAVHGKSRASGSRRALAGVASVSHSSRFSSFPRGGSQRFIDLNTERSAAVRATDKKGSIACRRHFRARVSGRTPTMATARRDTLLELQAKAQKKWADEKTFEVTAPRDGTCDLGARDFPSREGTGSRARSRTFSRRVGPGRPARG